MRVLKQFLSILAITGVFVSLFSATVAAHVTVKPAEVATASYQTFIVSVPNEKEVPTTAIKLLIPEAVTSVKPTVKPGWTIATEKSGEGETAQVTSITWSDGEIADGLRDDFTFSAKAPDVPGEIEWKAYQTYSDGTVVAWDQASSGDSHGAGENTGPLSVTNVVEGASTDSHDGNEEMAAEDDSQMADIAIYVAGAALIISFVAIFFATRKK